MSLQQRYTVYPYRWAILTVFMLINAVIQIQWLSHAPVARAAEAFYAGQFDPGSLVNIDFLAMSYMLIYLVVCIPASYVIDTYGIRVGISIGAVLAGGAGLVKGIMADRFGAVVLAQVGLAISQPFVLNAVTALSARWFPLKERGLAAGLAALAQYLGIIVAMGVTPMLVVTSPESARYGEGLDHACLIYGIITFVVALATLIVLKERPPTPPSDQAYQPVSFSRGLKRILTQRDMVITILLFLIGLGIFNAVSSMVDSIADHLGVQDSDGLIGVAMLLGGVLGALILPALSDKLRLRKPFLVLSMAGMIVGVACLTFTSVYSVALTGSAVLGFFLMSAGPIGFQYAAEVSYPAPESTSQGLLLLSGQITGLLFVAGMSMRSNQYLGAFMLLFFVLSIAAFAVVLLLRESPMIRAEQGRA